MIDPSIEWHLVKEIRLFVVKSWSCRCYQNAYPALKLKIERLIQDEMIWPPFSILKNSCSYLDVILCLTQSNLFTWFDIFQTVSPSNSFPSVIYFNGLAIECISYLMV